MFFKSTTILKLTLLGFILAAVPLTIGLLSTMFQVDRLAVQMQRAVHNSTQAVESGRLIATQALSMERSAMQYLVLRDEAILSSYQSKRVQFAQEIERLLMLPLDTALSARLQSLLVREASLYQKLRKATSQPPLNEEKLAATERLSELVRPIPFDVTSLVSRESSSMNRQIGQVQRLILWQTAALVPLALLIAVIFSLLISRPLRRLGEVIRQLGAGKFNAAIEVSGPQDIRELGQQLDWLRRQLAALDEQKLQFLHHVSHELKTPLTAIREGVGLLRDGIAGNLMEEQQEVVDILYENSLQLQNQVESLLNFNLALAQEPPLAKEPLDLAALLPSVVEKHQLAMRARNISIKFLLQPSFVNGDAEQLRAIVDNLLSNAIKYSPDGGEVRITLYPKNQNVILDIMDEGTGILPEDKPHLFEPFFQGKSLSSGPVQGTGLGLSLVERYLHLHGGSIRLIETRQGAHFQVTLPLISNVDNTECTN